MSTLLILEPRRKVKNQPIFHFYIPAKISYYYTKKYIGNRFTKAQIPLMDIVGDEDAVIINDFNTYSKIDDRIKTVFTKILS